MSDPPDRGTWEIARENFADMLLDLLADPTCDVFSCDEIGFEGDPRPRQRWLRRGVRPIQGYHGGHPRRNVL